MPGPRIKVGRTVKRLTSSPHLKIPGDKLLLLCHAEGGRARAE